MTQAKLRLTDREPLPGRRPPGLAAWTAAACAAIVTGSLLRVRSTPDVDLWLHLRIGDLLLSGQRFGGGADPLALLADRPYVPSQWLAQSAMSAVHEMAGMPGIQIARMILVLALGAAVLVGCRSAAGPTPALFATGIAMFGAGAAWGERPQLAGVVLLAVTVALWWRASDRGVVPWAVVPLTWVWSMLHGTWILGVAVGAALLVGGTLDRCWEGNARKLVAAVPVASVAVALLTPLGADVVLEPFRVSAVARLTANEWQSPEPGNPLLLVVLAAAVAALLGIMRSPRRRWSRVITVIVGVAMAVWMVRTIAIGAVVLAPAVAQGLASLRPSPTPPEITTRGGVHEWPLWVCSGALVVALAGSHLATTSFGAPVSPAVSTALKALPDDAVVAVDGRAVGWVQWEHPDRRPLRDLRAEVYSVPVATAYEDFQEARVGWQDYADAHGVTAVLADRKRPLDPALAVDPEWMAVADDTDFRLWVRR